MEFASTARDRADNSWPPSGVQEFLFLAQTVRRRLSPLRIFLLIFFGALGTLARYGLQGVVQARSGPGFPTGTLAVNLVGCLLLGCVGQFALLHLSVPPEWRIGVTVGFFGAFTTFSTFGWETVQMLRDGEWISAGIYIGLSVIGCLCLVKLGMELADRL